MIIVPSQVGLKSGDSGFEVTILKHFLMQYGYLGYTDSTNDQKHQGARSIDLQHETFNELIETGVKQYQEFNQLNTTGVLDKDTVRLMLQPRCGVIDIQAKKEGKVMDEKEEMTLAARIAPNIASVSKWNKFNLTYSIRNYTTGIDISQESQDMAIAYGLEQWANVVPFEFTRLDQPADLNFIFCRLRHNYHRGNTTCPTDFTGVGGQVAHAFFPLSGEAHFDDDETWVDTPDESQFNRDLYAAAVHEIGHLLGLNHSQSPDSIMYATHQNGKRTLTEDAISDIKNLYSS